MKTIFAHAASVALTAMLLGTATLPIPAAAQAQQAPKGTDVMAMQAGTWDAAITFPSQDPAKPAQTAKGVQVNRLRSNGMWIVNEFSVDGTPYQGTGVWGFDRTTGRYSGIWVDNNDQQIRGDDGHWNPETKVLTWTADMPTAEGRHQRLLFTEKFEGATRRFDMVALTRKGEVPLVSIVFTRRGG